MKTLSKTKSGTEAELDGGYWDDVAGQMEGVYSDNPFFQYKKRELLRLINNWAEDMSGRSILKTDLYEESLGYDDFLFDLAKGNTNVFGMDISPKMVEAAKKRAVDLGVNAQFSIQDARKTTFDSDAFDLIISNSTFDHFPEVEAAIAEMARILKPNGILILTLHNKSNPAVWLVCGLMKALNRYHNFYVEGSFSLKQTKKMSEKASLSVVDWDNAIFIPPLLPTLINKLYKSRYSFCKKLSKSIVLFFENIGKKNLFINRFTGYLVAVKAVKV